MSPSAMPGYPEGWQIKLNAEGIMKTWREKKYARLRTERGDYFRFSIDSHRAVW
jgi:hypothetical protein